MDSRLPGLRIAAHVLLLAGLLHLYLSLSQEHTFEFLWDMDAATAQDVLALNGGDIPSHNDHPKFGLNAVLSRAARWGRALDRLSVASLADLAENPSPMLGVAELTLFLRRVHAVMTFVVLLLAVQLVRLMSPGRPLFHLLVVPFLGFQAAMIYMASALRSELGSVLFLLASMVAFVLLRRGGWPGTAMALAGLLAGLAVLTKVQALVALPLLLALMVHESSREPHAAGWAEGPRGIRRGLAIWGASAGVMAVLAVAALLAPGVPGRSARVLPIGGLLGGEIPLASLLSHAKLQLFWIALLAAAPIGLLLARRGAAPALGPVLRGYPLFLAGIAASFLVPVVTFPGSLRDGWRYAAALLRAVLWSDTSRTSGSLYNTLRYVVLHRSDYLVLGALLVALVALPVLRARRAGEGLPPRETSLLLLAASGTGFLWLASRGVLRDTLWFEFLGSLTVMILLGHVLERLAGRPAARAALLAVVGGMGLYGWLSVDRERDNIYVYYAPYDSGHHRALVEGVYPDATPGYAAILSAAYEDRPERLVRAVGQAKGVAHLRGIADPLFVNRRLPVRAMGLVAAGFPAWKGEVGWARFDEVHPLLEGSLLVDPAAFASRPPGRDYVSGYSRDINARTVRTGGGEVVSILPAFHVDALVALSLADLRGLLGLDPIDREPHLRLTYDGERLEYYALRLSRFTEFSPEQLARLSHPAFFVIGWEHAGALRFPSWEGVRARWEEEPVGR